MNFQRSSVRIFVSQLGGSIISFGGYILFARQLQAAELGIFFLFQMVVSLVAVPANLGRGNAVIKKISENNRPSTVFATSIIYLIISNILVFIVVLVAKEYINKYIGVSVALLVVAGVLLHSLYTLPINVLKGELRVGETAEINLIQKLIWISTGVVLIQHGLGAYGLIYALLVSYAIGAIVAVYKISIQIGTPSLQAAKSLFNYWKYTTVSYVDSQIYNWADIAVIGLFLSQTNVGVYEIAWRVTTVVILLSTAIEQIILPQISSWESSDLHKNIQELFPNAILASVFLVIPSFFGVLLLSTEILTIIFGSEYAAGSLALIILVFSKLVESVDRIVKNFLEGLNLPNLRMRAVGVSIPLNIVLNLIFVQQFGIVGAALATTLAFSSSTILTYHYLTENIDVKMPYREIAWCILSGIGMSIILQYVQSVVQIDTVIGLTIMIMTGAITYFMLSFLYTPIRLKFRYNIRRIVG